MNLLQTSSFQHGRHGKVSFLSYRTSPCLSAVYQLMLTTMLQWWTLNSKPLGYTSSDLTDPDLITPNLLLMGRQDASLPQAAYGSSDLGCHCRRHRPIHPLVPSQPSTSLEMVALHCWPYCRPSNHGSWPTASQGCLAHWKGLLHSSQWQWKDSVILGTICSPPVTKLVLLPKVPDEDEDNNTTYNSRDVVFLHIHKYECGSAV